MLHFSNFAEVFYFIQIQGYWIVFLLMLIEGPIVTMAAAFAASFDVFNIYVIFVLSFFGNLIGDMFWYFLGKSGRKSIIDKYLEKREIKSRAIRRIEKLLDENYFKALLLIKIVPSLPVPGLIFTGMSRLKLKKMIFATITINLIYCSSFVVIGYYFGSLIRSHLLDVKIFEIVVISIVVVVVAILFYRKYSSKFYNNLGKNK